MRARDKDTVRALRTTLAARRELTNDDVRALVAAERDELLAADRPEDAAVLDAYV